MSTTSSPRLNIDHRWLWMLHISPGLNTPKVGEYKRFIDKESQPVRRVYNEWIQREEELVTINGDVPAIGKPSNHPSSAKFLAVTTKEPLSKIYGQLILSSFILEVAKNNMSQATGGSVRARGSDQLVKTSFGTRSTVVDELVGKIEQTGLANMEYAFITVILPLHQYNRLPTAIGTTDVFPDIVKEIFPYFNAERYEQADALLQWLLDAANSTSKVFEGDGQWEKAYTVYLDLFRLFSGVDDHKNFAFSTKKELRLFLERAVAFYYKSPSVDGPQSLVHKILIRGLKGVLAIEQLDGQGEECETLIPNNTVEGNPDQSRNLTYHELLLQAGDENQFFASSLPPPPSPSNTDHATVVDCWGRTPIVLASLRGHTTKVVQLLEHGYDATIQDRMGKTALHYASERGHSSVVRALSLWFLTNGDINIEDGNGKSPIDLAFENNDGATMRILRFYGGDISKYPRAEYLRASIQNASYTGSKIQQGKKTSNSMIDEGGSSRLCLTVCSGAPETVRTLLETSSKAAEDIRARDKSLWTPLHYASLHGRLEIVELLVDRDSEFDAQDTHDATALYLASENGHERTIQMLIERKAKVNIKGGRYGTAIQAAAYSGSEGAVRILIDNGAEINAEGGYYGTALQAAAHSGSERAVRILIDNGADINAEGGYYGTALQAAAHSGSPGTVRVLISKDAKLNIEGGFYGTALHAATRAGNVVIVDILIEKGCLIGSRDGERRTPLSRAAENGHADVVQLLVDRPDVATDSSDEWGRTPLSWAERNYHSVVAHILTNRTERT